MALSHDKGLSHPLVYDVSYDQSLGPVLVYDVSHDQALDHVLAHEETNYKMLMTAHHPPKTFWRVLGIVGGQDLVCRLPIV